MKKFFSSIFNAHPQVKNISKDKEEDDLIDRLENETYLSNEFRFQHQNEKCQLRATPNEKVTLGVLLNRTFDIRQEEVSDRKSTRLNSSHTQKSRMPSSA